MFDVSLTELFLVVVAAVIFIGPKELPTVVRAVARGLKALRALTKDVRKAFDALVEESGVKETADTFNAEIRLIKGDDGQFYESYELSKLPTDRERGG
jgi:Tat protein translocase TatB subunit